ncbi:hypothetical protein HMPREF0043_01331, partial [Actinobaculum sp. oral taxon 183 str. F0552]
IDLGEVDVEGDDVDPRLVLQAVELGQPGEGPAAPEAGAEPAEDRGAETDADRTPAPETAAGRRAGQAAGAPADRPPTGSGSGTGGTFSIAGTPGTAGTGAASPDGTSGAGGSPGTAGTVGGPAGGFDGPDAQDDGIEGELPDFGDGPLLVVSDVSFGALPGAAASLDTELAAFRINGLTAVVAEAKPARSNAPGASADFALVLSVDPTGLDTPILTVRTDGTRLTWTWSDDLQYLPWLAAEPAARSFAADELGAGAFAGRIARFLPVDPAAIRAILAGDTQKAPELLVRVFGLPGEVADCLHGLLVPRVIPGAVLFEPKPFAARLQSSVAHAVAGEGASASNLIRAYRKVYLEHPRVTEIVASVQAGVGVLAFAAGVRSWGRPRGKLLSILGGGLAVNAVTRILTTQWIQAALRIEGLSVTARDEEGEEGDQPAGDSTGDAAAGEPADSADGGPARGSGSAGGGPAESARQEPASPAAPGDRGREGGGR